MAQLQYSKLDASSKSKRKQLKAVMDNFCTFGFDTISPNDMFDRFGAFIINDKNSLKFYNGPGFSNDYTKPQFAKYNQLAGVTFKTQQLKFKIGLYWFSIDEYRQFLNEVLNPLKIGNLWFSFSPEWCYQVKLSSISDSTRYIIGHFNGDRTEANYAYYTEIDVTWEIQGESCGRGMEPCNILINSSTSNELRVKVAENYLDSALSSPFVLHFNLDLQNVTTNDVPISIIAQYQNHSTTLASFTLTNWTKYSNDEDQDFYVIHLTYNSESGTLYYSYGNSQSKILNSLNTTSSGKKLVSNLLVNKFKYPGSLETDVDWSKINIVISSNQPVIFEPNSSSNSDYLLEIYPRTNVL